MHGVTIKIKNIFQMNTNWSLSKFLSKKRRELPQYFFSVTQQPNSRLDRLIVEISRSHTDSYTWQDSCWGLISPFNMPQPTQQATNTRTVYPCPQCDSNPRFQQSSGFIHGLRQHGHWDWFSLIMGTEISSLMSRIWNTLWYSDIIQCSSHP